MAYIYKITNDINDKVYVGQTTLTLEKRFQKHCSDAWRRFMEHRPLYAAMRKYGCGSFHISLIEECSTEQASEREIYWIGFYNGFTHGYNATTGGEGKARFNHDEIIAKLKAHPYAADIANEVGCSTDTIYNIAKTHSIVLLNRAEETQDERRRKVEQYDTQGDLVNCFASTVEAGKWCQLTGLTGDRLCASHISQCALGKRKTAYGYQWKYIN